MENKSFNLKPRFSVYPEWAKSDELPQPARAVLWWNLCSRSWLCRTASWMTLPKASCFCSQQHHGGAVWLMPCTDPSENDHWQPSWWVSNAHCSHILHDDLKEAPVWPGLHCHSPATHTHILCFAISSSHRCRGVSCRCSETTVSREVRSTPQGEEWFEKRIKHPIAYSFITQLAAAQA